MLHNQQQNQKPFQNPNFCCERSFRRLAASLKLHIFSKYAIVLAHCQPPKLRVLATKAGFEMTSAKTRRETNNCTSIFIIPGKVGKGKLSEENFFA